MNFAGYIQKRGIQRKLIISFVMMGLIPMIIMGSVFYYKSSQTAKTIEQMDAELRLYKMQLNNVVVPSQTVVI